MAVFQLGKRLEGAGGVEEHIGQARAAANEAIADLRQQIVDEEKRREELGHVLEARIAETENELRMSEERNRELLGAKDADAKGREEALAVALQRVKTGVEELVTRAEGMEEVQRTHSKDLKAAHAAMNKVHEPKPLTRTPRPGPRPF
jgi:hypothetical protein